MKLENCQCDYIEGKSNGFEALADLHKDLEAWNVKENKRILIYMVMHPDLEIPSDKHMEDQKLAINLRVGEILGETKSATLIEYFQFDLNVGLEPQKEEMNNESDGSKRTLMHSLRFWHASKSREIGAYTCYTSASSL
ncbi:hypothetical protein H5410_002130 [Solanum commersonii]|uniref:Uncharacterized protein n=1 Tax=Solanum commersonii TaxID=4109 RepID=A0A9J6B0T4_SOLCO|nr:hypothetical protein H5410_002130 [Solanum commersonii]